MGSEVGAEEGGRHFVVLVVGSLLVDRNRRFAEGGLKGQPSDRPGGTGFVPQALGQQTANADTDQGIRNDGPFRKGDGEGHTNLGEARGER